MSVGFIYVMLNELYPGLLKIGKTKKHPNQRAKELSGTAMLHPFRVTYFVKVSDCNLAEQHVHAELKQFRQNPKREFFEMPITKAKEVIQRIVKEVNSQIPFPVPAKFLWPADPARPYNVFFSCERCGKYRSNTVEHLAGKVQCPLCQHENDLNIAWS